jgi:hypothetical protein
MSVCWQALMQRGTIKGIRAVFFGPVGGIVPDLSLEMSGPPIACIGPHCILFSR